MRDAGTSRFLLNTIDLNPHLIPQRPGGYLRISEDPRQLQRGVTAQMKDSQGKGKALGWAPIFKWYIENDTSAFKKRRVMLADGSVGYRNIRPEFIAMLADLANGTIDGVVVYDQDRLLRQPRDLEDLIDLCERMRFPVAGVTGMIDLLTSNGRLVARMMAAVAIKSSEDTSRRVARMALADAEAGTTTLGGPRRFGWDADGSTLRPDEAAIILEIRDRVMMPPDRNGRPVWSKGAIALDLQARGIPTSGGAEWAAATITSILRNPRLAGIRAYTGVFHGKDKPGVNQWWERTVRLNGEYVMGSWTPVMSVDEWEALQHVLDGRRGDSHRGNNGFGRGNPKHLLTGIAECGVCGTKMVGRVMAGRAVYGCRPRDIGGCNSVSRNVQKVDELVLELALRHLQNSRIASRTPKPTVSTSAADAQIARIEKLMADVKAEWRAGRYDSKDYFTDVAGFKADLERLRSEAATLPPATRPPRKVMVEELSNPETTVARRRALLSEVLEAVVINKSSRGPHFTPADIRPRWRAELSD